MVTVLITIEIISFVYTISQYVLNKDTVAEDRTSEDTKIYEPVGTKLFDNQKLDLIIFYIMQFMKKIVWQYPFIYILWPNKLVICNKKVKSDEKAS